VRISLDDICTCVSANIISLLCIIFSQSTAYLFIFKYTGARCFVTWRRR